jgi:CheY-like chemotaxis protein
LLEPVRPILIVDDDPAMLKLFSALLRVSGYQTRTAPNSVRAYEELVSEQTPLMLITDVKMPGHTDGAMLAQVAAQSWPDLPIVVMSGNTTPRKGELPAGAVFMRKPIGTLALLKQVEIMVGPGGR